MSAVEGAVVGLGVLACVAGLLAVTSTRLLRATLWLVAALVAGAGIYLALGAELVALVQVLVYVGAVVVLVVLAMMVTRSPLRAVPEHSGSPARRGLAALAGAGTTGLLLAVLVPLARAWEDEGGAAGAAAEGGPRPAASEGIAEQIFGTWVLPFELLSLLLLVALVAALAITRGERTR